MQSFNRVCGTGMTERWGLSHADIKILILACYHCQLMIRLTKQHADTDITSLVKVFKVRICSRHLNTVLLVLVHLRNLQNELCYCSHKDVTNVRSMHVTELNVVVTPLCTLSIVQQLFINNWRLCTV